MLVKSKKTGDIVEAKRFKDMTESEQQSTITTEYVRSLVTDNYIFTKPPYWSKVWSVFLEEEVEIVEEEMQCKKLA